ncbi:MAG: serine/threonine-protein phosphatase [Candidatus Magasanikbacteria bacterium]|nr:serine/threonine-protein phosphatase [Candidatus Magasanikbacteria bacterium]
MNVQQQSSDRRGHRPPPLPAEILKPKLKESTLTEVWAGAEDEITAELDKLLPESAGESIPELEELSAKEHAAMAVRLANTGEDAKQKAGSTLADEIDTVAITQEIAPLAAKEEKSWGGLRKLLNRAKEALGLSRQESKEAAKKRSGAATEASENHRERNEDKFIEDTDLGLYAIFDGMGGQANGEKASNMAKELVLQKIKGLDKNVTGEPLLAALKQIYLETNQAIWEDPNGAKNVEPKKAMGTTATTVLMRENKAYIAQVGDSRVYRFRGGKLEQITKDDSAATYLLDVHIKKGNLTQAQAEKINLFLENYSDDSQLGQLTEHEKSIFKTLYENRHGMYKTIGLEENIDPAVLTVDLEPGDRLIITSDGIHDPLTHIDLEAQLNAAANSSAKETAEVILQLVINANANPLSKRSKPDDKTVLVVDAPRTTKKKVRAAA